MKKFWYVIIAMVLLPSLATAEALKVGIGAGVSSFDPHFHNITPNNSANYNVFDGLINLDSKMNPYPVLAESWKIINDTTWEFKLQKGVKFHNGNPFNADDVVYSFKRATTGKSLGFKGMLSAIKDCVKVDEYTVRMTTHKPFPILLQKLSSLRIMDKEYSSALSDEELGRNPNGTGPYKLVKWVRGQFMSFEANKDYFRGKPAIDSVLVKELSDDSTRTAALLSGEVHLINRVPVRDFDRVKRQKGIDLYVQPGLRLIYLQFDHARDKSPYVSGADANPFKDVRVRKAFYYGINEDAIVKHIMSGFAKAAAQYYPAFVFGHDSSIERPKYDPEKAKTLLREAGYEKGFKVVLDSPNDRFVNDEKIVQAIASYLAKIDIEVTVNAIPKASFFPKANSSDSSFNMIGWACGDGDGSSFLEGNVHTYDQQTGYGRYNGGRYSTPEVDKLIEESAGIMDPKQRLAMLQKAMNIALIQDQNIIPLHFQVDLYGHSSKLTFEPRAESNLYFYDMKFK
jgi:peptide/nickel transport system substrate-binding protein